MTKQAHWLMPIKDRIYRCPNCDRVLPYGARRSLLSLIPGICRHVYVHFDSFVDHEHESYIIADLPVINVREQGWKARLRSRLTSEIKGDRKHWWGPYTKEYKAEREKYRIPPKEGRLTP